MRKMTDDLIAFVALLGSTRVKAARKHVGEIDTSSGCNLTSSSSACHGRFS
jgi:hypothetical protein